MSEETDSVVRKHFERYVEGFRRGQGDPGPIMEGLDEQSRFRLRRMIDEYLETGPVPDPDLYSPDDPEVHEIVAAIMPSLDGRSGGLSLLLARRRGQLGLNQADVVDSLVEDFKASPAEAEKIDAYYHDLEWGSLPAAGLTDRLLDSLAKALETTRGRLREAGRALGPGRAGSTGPVFARNADQVEEMASLGQASPGVAPARSASPPDRIDELFTAG